MYEENDVEMETTLICVPEPRSITFKIWFAPISLAMIAAAILLLAWF